MCLFAGEEVGIDVQIHKKVNYERILERMVPADMIREILDADDMEKAFFAQITAFRCSYASQAAAFHCSCSFRTAAFRCSYAFRTAAFQPHLVSRRL